MMCELVEKSAAMKRERLGPSRPRIGRMTSRSRLPKAKKGVGFVDEVHRSQTRVLQSIEFHQLMPDPVWSEMLARAGR